MCYGHSTANPRLLISNVYEDQYLKIDPTLGLQVTLNGLNESHNPAFMNAFYLMLREKEISKSELTLLKGTLSSLSRSLRQSVWSKFKKNELRRETKWFNERSNFLDKEVGAVITGASEWEAFYNLIGGKRPAHPAACGDPRPTAGCYYVLKHPIALSTTEHLAAGSFIYVYNRYDFHGYFSEFTVYTGPNFTKVDDDRRAARGLKKVMMFPCEMTRY